MREMPSTTFWLNVPPTVLTPMMVVGLMLSIAATKSRVGAQLARIEGEIAIGTLLRRLPNLRLNDVDHPDWRQTFVLRGLNKLPARW
jgi:hypothetical protein